MTFMLSCCKVSQMCTLSRISNSFSAVFSLIPRPVVIVGGLRFTEELWPDSWGHHLVAHRPQSLDQLILSVSFPLTLIYVLPFYPSSVVSYCPFTSLEPTHMVMGLVPFGTERSPDRLLLLIVWSTLRQCIIPIQGPWGQPLYQETTPDLPPFNDTRDGFSRTTVRGSFL